MERLDRWRSDLAHCCSHHEQDLHSHIQTQYYLTMSHGTGGTVSPASGWKNSGVAVSINAMPGSRLPFQQLDGQRNRILLWHEQSGLNHNERTYHRDGDFHS